MFALGVAAFRRESLSQCFLAGAMVQYFFEEELQSHARHAPQGTAIHDLSRVLFGLGRGFGPGFERSHLGNMQACARISGAEC